MKCKIHHYCWKTCNLVTKMYNHGYLGGRVIVVRQGSKLALANLQNACDFDNLRVRKISTSKHLSVRIIYVSQTFGESCLNTTPAHSSVVVVLHGFGAIVFLRMSKITFFFERPSGPSTSNMSASVDEDLEPVKNKSGSISILLIHFWIRSDSFLSISSTKMLVYGNNQTLESYFASGLYVTVQNINSNLYIRYGHWHFKGKEFAGGLTSFLVEKNLTSKTLQVH